MANDLDRVTIEALEQQPSDMPSLQAFRRALQITMATVSEDEWRFERARLRMVLSIPELKAAQFGEYRRTVARLAEADCRRTGPRARRLRGAGVCRCTRGWLDGGPRPDARRARTNVPGAGFHGGRNAVVCDQERFMNYSVVHV